jgi:phosphatidylglycerophosphatase C
MKTIAVFDFDKTITDRHSFWRFMKFCSGSLKFYWAIIVLLPQIVALINKRISLMQLREKAIIYFFKGMSKSRYNERCKSFVEEKINQWISTEALEKISWHRNHAHTLVLLSNSDQGYLQIWANQYGFDIVLGSQLEFVNQKATGKLTGEHCYGQEKVKRLRSAVKDLDEYYMYAYGDSNADKYVLQIANKQYFRHFNLKIKNHDRQNYRAS